MVVENNRILKINLPLVPINRKHEIPQMENNPDEFIRVLETTLAMVPLTTETISIGNPITTSMRHRKIYIRGHLVGEITGRRDPNTPLKVVIES